MCLILELQAALAVPRYPRSTKCSETADGFRETTLLAIRVCLLMPRFDGSEDEDEYSYILRSRVG